MKHFQWLTASSGLIWTLTNGFLSYLVRSFVPPTRDEESETQRKAHAKRVRETRRSTQGVTLDEIKSAEQLVKMKNATNNNGTAVSFNFAILWWFCPFPDWYLDD